MKTSESVSLNLLDFVPLESDSGSKRKQIRSRRSELRSSIGIKTQKELRRTCFQQERSFSLLERFYSARFSSAQPNGASPGGGEGGGKLS